MPTIKSRLITGVVGNEVTNQNFRHRFGLSSHQELAYTVMETKVDGVIYYCCCSGGEIDNNHINLTEFGHAALEVLMALPVGNNDEIYIQQLKMGKTSLKKKVIRMLKEKPKGSKVCFVGDWSGELDSEMVQAFNVQGSKKL